MVSLAQMEAVVFNLARVDENTTKTEVNLFFQYYIAAYVAGVFMCLCGTFVCFITSFCPHPPIDSILKLMTLWRITRKIIRTTIMVNCICTCIMEFLQL